MTKKKRRRHKRMPWTEKDRLEGDPPRPEYLWMNSVNNVAGPGNRSGIPAGLRGMSEDPDEVLAWIKKNCKFAMEGCGAVAKNLRKP